METSDKPIDKPADKTADKPDLRVYDPAELLTRSSLWFVGILIVFTCAVIAAQIWLADDHKASTDSWSALTFLIGWATAKVGDIFNNRFGSTSQSNNKDITIAQQARTAAVAQNALLDPNVTVTTTTTSKPDTKEPQ